MAAKKKVSIELVFDDKDAAHAFIAYWLDGGGDGGGNMDWNTDPDESDDWTKKVPKMLRIKGTGNPIVWEGDEMFLQDPNGKLIPLDK